MKKEGSGNDTGLKFESRTRTQSRTRSPICKQPVFAVQVCLYLKNFFDPSDISYLDGSVTHIVVMVYR